MKNSADCKHIRSAVMCHGRLMRGHVAGLMSCGYLVFV